MSILRKVSHRYRVAAFTRTIPNNSEYYKNQITYDNEKIKSLILEANEKLNDLRESLNNVGSVITPPSLMIYRIINIAYILQYTNMFSNDILMDYMYEIMIVLNSSLPKSSPIRFRLIDKLMSAESFYRSKFK